ncbi:MAG TPA: hybrid sensor histidine kinase/response regulator [Prolixibacteraceae bacterium]|nr:hybrid sensor histidine kinase/response regulator [Prolixibacteraceae bacterium]
MNKQLKDKLSILAVDDNQMNLMVMKSMFKNLEYEVFYADCGQGAIDMARDLHPDMILLDVVMPDISGFDVCRTLKEDNYFKDVPVIFITAADEIEFIINGFEAGGVDYVVKPFRKEDILLRIKTHFELKLTRDQLMETTQTLTELNNVKDRLFSIIGHDLRSPIGNVKMVLEFMSKGIIDPSKGDEYKKTVQDLLRTTDEVFSLLENLLAWSTSESGNQSIIPENINLKEAVVSIVNLYQAGINNKNISLDINIDPEQVVYADLNMIKTVIRNLFSNAIKYTPSEGSISFNSWPENGNVKIGLSDTGRGMTPDEIAKILDPNIFFSTVGINKESGNGLGLKLCLDFIKKSGGRIWIESTPNVGSTVFFTLPAENKDVVADESKALIW